MSPTAAPSDATVAVFSDCHLRAEVDPLESGPDERLRRSVDLAAPLSPDLVVLAGDIADDATPAAYRRTREIVEALGVPIVAIPGNHDRIEPLRDVFGDSADATVGGWRVVGLDTTIDGCEHGRLDVRSLDEALGPDQRRPTVVVVHHPPLTRSSHPSFQLLGAMEVVAALSARTDVTCLVSGHLHDPFHLHLAGVTYVGCSSTWCALRLESDNYEVIEDGHVGALALRLRSDGSFGWKRLPDLDGQDWEPSRQ